MVMSMSPKSLLLFSIKTLNSIRCNPKKADLSILLTICFKIHITSGNCAGWITVDKDVFQNNPKEYEELQTLDKSGIFSDKIKYRKEGHIFFIK